MNDKTILRSLLFLLAAICLTAVSAGAQTKPADKKEDYDTMVKRLKGGDVNIDFGALRQAYTESKDFSGYGDSGKREMFVALNAKKFKDALALAEKRLNDDYVDLNAHFVAAVANRELGNTDQAQFHHQIFAGLVESILQGHDGQSPATAYSVISIDEEHVVIEWLDFTFTGTQSLVQDRGHAFDTMSVMDPKTKKASVLYFNIDRFFGKF